MPRSATPLWLIGISVVTALACVSGARSLGTSEAPDEASLPAEPVPVPALPASSPTPLTEIDVDAALAAAPEPEPAPEPVPVPVPFDAEQLERINAVQDIVAAASTAYGVDPTLINALIWVESKFEGKARGPAGAQGLMQLMPKTAQAMAKRLGRKRNSYDPDFNIHAGTLLLSRLLARFDGDVRLALAGYNRGGGTVSKWVAAGEEFPEGVQTFVARVLEAQARFERLPSPLELEADGGQDR